MLQIKFRWIADNTINILLQNQLFVNDVIKRSLYSEGALYYWTLRKNQIYKRYIQRETKQAFKEYSQKAYSMMLMSVSPDEFKTFVMPNIFGYHCVQGA